MKSVGCENPARRNRLILADSNILHLLSVLIAAVLELLQCLPFAEAISNKVKMPRSTPSTDEAYSLLFFFLRQRLLIAIVTSLVCVRVCVRVCVCLVAFVAASICDTP